MKQRDNIGIEYTSTDLRMRDVRAALVSAGLIRGNDGPITMCECVARNVTHGEPTRGEQRTRDHFRLLRITQEKPE